MNDVATNGTTGAGSTACGSRRPVALPILVVAAVLGLLAVHLVLAAEGFPIHRDQHLGAALEYAAHGIDLLRPAIPGFNANGAPTPQEVPLWQAAAALALRWGGGWWGWGNVVAWLCFASALPPFFLLAKRVMGSRAAWWCLLVFALQPLIILESGQAGTDGTALAASIWFLFAAERMIATGAWSWWPASAALGAVAATQKLPFFMAAGIAAVGLLAFGDCRRDRRRWFQLVLAGALAAAAFAVWSAYTESQFARAEFPLIDLRIGNPAMRRWYFGGWPERADPIRWVRGAYRLLTGVFGDLVLVLIAAGGALQKRQRLARSWLAGAAICTLVFTNLVLQHWHYYLMVSPAVALLGGGAISQAEEWIRSRSGIAGIRFVAPVAAAYVLAGIQGVHAGHLLLRDPYPRDVARILHDHTAAADRILIAGGGWGGEELLWSGRRGLSIWNARLLENPVVLSRLRALGFTKLALLSESPRRAAVAILGGSEPRRMLWNELGASVVRDWPVIVRTPDICLLALPPDAPATPGGPRR